MLVRFADKCLERLERDPGYTGDFGADVVKMFRRRMQFIRSATNERDFYSMKSLHFEKLSGKRAHQRSMRLNDQWRLIIQLEKDDSGKIVVVVAIEDYH